MCSQHFFPLNELLSNIKIYSIRLLSVCWIIDRIMSHMLHVVILIKQPPLIWLSIKIGSILFFVVFVVYILCFVLKKVSKPQLIFNAPSSMQKIIHFYMSHCVTEVSKIGSLHIREKKCVLSFVFGNATFCSIELMALYSSW